MVDELVVTQNWWLHKNEVLRCQGVLTVNDNVVAKAERDDALVRSIVESRDSQLPEVTDPKAADVDVILARLRTCGLAEVLDFVVAV